MFHFSANLCRLYFVLVVVTLVFSGCASKKIQGPETVFWPEQPSLPRIQFLKSVNGDYDIVDQKAKVSFLTIGETAESKIDPLIKPNGVEARNGKIYVCDPGRSTVFIIDLVNQTFITMPGNKNHGAMNKPMNLDFDDEGNIYVADVNRREILIYNPEGYFLRSFGRSLDMKPTDVGVYGDFVYVSDLFASDIKVLDRKTGKLLDSIGRDAATYEDNLSVPANLAIDSEGFIYTTNVGTGRIIKLDRDGHVMQAFGRLGTNFANFGRPRGITVDKDGKIYIVDAAHQNVQIFDNAGRLLMFFGGRDALSGGMNLPAGVTITRDNLEYFQTLAAPEFELESVLLVTNHFGDNRLGIYGLGKLRGVDYEQEYEMIKKELEKMSRAEKERRAAEEQQQ